MFGRVWACGFYRLVFFFVLILSLFFSRDVGSEVVLNVNNGCENKNERLPSFGELGSVDQSKTACGLFQIHACCFFLIFLILKKKIHLAKERFKNPLKSHSPQLFRHSSLGLFWKNRIICSSQQHTTRNKKELSIISRSDETMMMMCVNCCVIHFSTFR